jgi:hypothetical protein
LEAVGVQDIVPAAGDLRFVATPEEGEVSALLMRPAHATHLLTVGHSASTHMRHSTLQAIAERLADTRIATLGHARGDPALPGPQAPKREGPLPEKHHAELDRLLSEAYQETDYATAAASLKGMARWLDRLNPDAASSLREGLEETLTVVKLGAPGALRRTLAMTNPIESALSVTRRATSRETRWRDGDMRRRWCVAGLLPAESKFRRVKGYRAIPALIKALEGSARAQPAGTGRGVA